MKAISTGTSQPELQAIDASYAVSMPSRHPRPAPASTDIGPHSRRLPLAVPLVVSLPDFQGATPFAAQPYLLRVVSP